MHPKSLSNFWGAYFYEKKETTNKKYSLEFKISVILNNKIFKRTYFTCARNNVPDETLVTVTAPVSSIEAT